MRPHARADLVGQLALSLSVLVVGARVASAAVASNAAGPTPAPSGPTYIEALARGLEPGVAATGEPSIHQSANAVGRLAEPASLAAIVRDAVRQLDAVTSPRDTDPVGERARHAESLRRFDGVLALVERRLLGIRERLGRLGLDGPEIHERQREAEGAIATLRGQVARHLRDLETDPGDPAALRAAVDHWASIFMPPRATARATIGESRILRAALPFGARAWPNRPPPTDLRVIASYEDSLAGDPQPEDLQPTPEAPFSAAVTEAAQQLAYDPARIVRFVRDEIATEWYAGLQKGAEQTLHQRAGNDVDQANLLVALLRASATPCRYVRGVIEAPVADLARALGLDDPVAIGRALNRAGIASRPNLLAGTIASFTLEANWVSAWVPYANYRGAMIDASGASWLPIFPAWKRWAYAPGRHVLEAMGFSADDFAADFLAHDRERGVMPTLRERVDTYLEEHDPGSTFVEQLSRRSFEASGLELVAGSAPFRIVGVEREGVRLELKQHQVLSIEIRPPGAPANGPALLSARWSTGELASRLITLSYLPASVDDHAVVNAFGGLDHVPAYLVRVAPWIHLDGSPAAAGPTELPGFTGDARRGVPPGTVLEVHLRLEGPGGAEATSFTSVAGDYHALTVGAQSTRRPVASDDLLSRETRAARLLGRLGADFHIDWEADQVELARLLDVAVVRPLPSVTVTSLAVAVEHLGNLPFDLELRAVIFDALAQPVDAIGSAARQRAWNRLAGLAGSDLEARTLHRLLRVESISTSRALQLAHQQGLPVITLGVGASSSIDDLDLPAPVEQDIAVWLHRGLTVQAPRGVLRHRDWEGAAWKVEDPVTGAQGWFLAGSIAGGSTIEDPLSWLLDSLADALGAPYGGVPNEDPNAAVELQKLPNGDGQHGTVGEQVARPLGVLARDERGRPVKGARVEFRVVSGGGTLDRAAGSSDGLATLEVATGPDGMARAWYRNGTDTTIDPVFVRRDPKERFAHRALFALVDAAVPSGPSIPSPFQAIGFPASPARLRRTDTEQLHFPTVRPWSQADRMLLQVEDRFGNSIANEVVEIQARDGERDATCSNLGHAPFEPAHVEDARRFASGEPICPAGATECRGTLVRLATSAGGLAIDVFTGQSIAAIYHVAARVPERPGLGRLDYTYSSTYLRESTTAICRYDDLLLIRAEAVTNRAGESIESTVPGGEHWGLIRTGVLAWTPDFESFIVNGAPQPRPLDTGGWRPARARIDLATEGPGRVIAARDLPDAHQIEVRLGAIDATGRVDVRGHASEILRPWPAFDSAGQSTGFGWLPWPGAIEESIFTFWSVAPRVDHYAPDPIAIDDAGRSQVPTEVRYSIHPPEYPGDDVALELVRDETVVGTAPGSPGAGSVSIPRGWSFDPARNYSERVALNRGTPFAVLSQPKPLRLTRRTLLGVYSRHSAPAGPYGPAASVARRTGAPIIVAQDLDLWNQRACPRADEIVIHLADPARVTARFRRVTGLGADLEPMLDGETHTLLDNALLPAGENGFLVAPSGLGGAFVLPPGDYELVVEAVNANDDHREESRHHARSVFSVRDLRPVGHSAIDGVDVFDGGLAVHRQDLAIAGRGPGLDLARTYLAGADFEAGPMGIGWRHSWESAAFVTPCGELVVQGAAGQSQRFVDDGHGGLRPVRGYHGSLIFDPADGSLDFHPKDGSRQHFVRRNAIEWRLAFVEDANGNRVTMHHGYGNDAPLLAVEDGAGRRLSFAYEQRTLLIARTLELVSRPLLVRVDGPEGFRLDLVYDSLGQLVRARREAGGTDEAYSYAPLPDPVAPFRRGLVEVRDLRDGSRQRFTYGPVTIGLGLDNGTDIEVSRLAVVELTKPEGGVYRFEYGADGLRRRAAGEEIVHRVVDPLGHATEYGLNDYGAVVRRTDPLGHSETTEWDMDDIRRVRHVDARGVATRWTYDGEGNPRTETVRVIDFDGTGHDYVRSTDWAPADHFEVPGIKDRPLRSVDRDGRVIEFEYDERGNPVGEAVRVRDVDGNETRLVRRSAFAENGDLVASTDRRGATTRFEYDARGLMREMTDALGATRTFEHDDRGRRVREIDPLGRSTVTGYDALDRRTLRRHPDGAEERIEHDDATRTERRVDELGGTWVLRRDREGRIVEEVDPLGARREFRFDASGRPTEESTWFDERTQRFATLYEHDAAGRLVRRHEPEGRRVEMVLDPAGNAVRETISSSAPGDSFRPRVTERRFDALGRTIEVARLLDDGARVVRRTRFDGEGHAVLEEDPLGRRRERLFDELGREIREVGPEWAPGLPLEIRRHYDGEGALLAERTANLPRDRTRRWRRDLLGREIEREDGLEAVFSTEYDAVGNVVREIDPRLTARRHEVDARNRRVRTTTFLSRFTRPARQVVEEWAYDAQGNLIEQRAPNGNVTTIGRDALGREVERRDSLGLLSTRAYDARGNVLVETDANGHRTERRFDGRSRLLVEELPARRTTRHRYDAADNRVATENARGFTTRFEHDTLDRLVRTVDPPEAGSTFTRVEYDLAGNLVAETDRRGSTRRHRYDLLDRRIETIDPAPLSGGTTRRHDGLGNVVSEVDRRGIETRREFDIEGRVLTVTRDGLTIEANEWDPNGNLLLRTDANGSRWGFEWDERNLKLADNGPLAAITRHDLDAMGDVTRTVDPQGNVSTVEYDLRRRRVAESNGAGETTRFDYDPKGNQIAKRRPGGAKWRYEFDAADRLVAVVDPLGATTRHGYDGQGNRVTQADANGRIVSFTFDALDRRVARRHPDGTSEAFGYDENGNLVSRVDADGRSFASSYDPLDRLIAETFPVATPDPGGQLLSITHRLDGNGNRIETTERWSAPEGDRVTRQTFDTFERLEQRTDARGRTFRHAYDAVGNRVRLTDPDGEVTRYTYDALHRMTSVDAPGLGITTYTWRNDSLLEAIRRPGAGATRYTYDAARRTTGIEHLLGVAPVASHTYSHDVNGNRLTLVEVNGGAAETTRYQYDAVERLLGVEYPDRSITYAYDPVGNRIAETVTPAGATAPASSKTLSYDERDRIVAISDPLDPATNTEFDHDRHGNLTRRRRGDATTTTTTDFSWDTRNQLVEVRQDGALLEAYGYDHEGHRVRKAGSEGVRRFVYDGDRLALTTDEVGSTQERHHFGPLRLPLGTCRRGDGAEFHLLDALGTTIASQAPDGTVTARHLWDPWGAPRAPIPSLAFGYTAYQRDATTGLHYALARFYDPTVGRFLSEDPVEGVAAEPPSLHRFAYAQLRPTILTDPLGLCSGMACADLIDHRQEFAAAKERSRERLAEACGQDPTSPVCFGPLGQALVRTFGDDHAALLSQGSPTHDDRLYVTVVNGVQNTEEDARDRLDRISDLFGRRAEALWNPTAGKSNAGKVADILQVLAVDKFLLVDRSTDLLFHQLRARTAALLQGEVHLAVAHSQGAAKLAAATWLLRPDERARLEVITFGEATSIYPKDLAGMERYLNPSDVVAFLAGTTPFAPDRILLPMRFGDHSLSSYLDAYHLIRRSRGPGSAESTTASVTARP